MKITFQTLTNLEPRLEKLRLAALIIKREVHKKSARARFYESVFYPAYSYLVGMCGVHEDHPVLVTSEAYDVVRLELERILDV